MGERRHHCHRATHIPNDYQSRCLRFELWSAEEFLPICYSDFVLGKFFSLAISLAEIQIRTWIEYCRVQVGLFFASKMHDKQRQRFSVKAPSFFRTPSFESICIAASASAPVLSFSMDFFALRNPRSPLIGRKEEPFQNFNGPKSQSVCKVGRLIGKKKYLKEESPPNVLCDILCGQKSG